MDIPDLDTFETTLIGTGGGYGESIIIHLGKNNWIVVDSCEDPDTKLVLPLEYLKKIGVDIKTQIKLIICTHWHDDHIRGISKLLSEAEQAVFVIAKANDRKKFLKLVNLDYQKRKDNTSISSTLEFNQCLEILRNRKTQLKIACEDRVLLNIVDDTFKAEVISLSPSDYVIEQFDYEVSSLITEYGDPRVKLVIESPNDKSVVLLIKVNSHRVLLGSDLEISKDKRKGWLRILNDIQTFDSKCHLFKIPHHGSDTGFESRVWDELLEKNVIAKLTPWNKGKGLPQKDMINKFLSLTENLYITSQQETNIKPKKRDSKMTKVIKGFNDTLVEQKFSQGIVRSRIGIDSVNNVWETKTFEEGKKLS